MESTRDKSVGDDEDDILSVDKDPGGCRLLEPYYSFDTCPEKQSLVNSLVDGSIDVVDVPSIYFVGIKLVKHYISWNVTRASSYMDLVLLPGNKNLLQRFSLPLNNVTVYDKNILFQRMSRAFLCDTMLTSSSLPKINILDGKCTTRITHSLVILANKTKGFFMKITPIDANYMTVWILPECVKRGHDNTNNQLFPVSHDMLIPHTFTCEVCLNESVEHIFIIDSMNMLVCSECRKLTWQKISNIVHNRIPVQRSDTNTLSPLDEKDIIESENISVDDD